MNEFNCLNSLVLSNNCISSQGLLMIYELLLEAQTHNSSHALETLQSIGTKRTRRNRRELARRSLIHIDRLPDIHLDEGALSSQLESQTEMDNLESMSQVMSLHTLNLQNNHHQATGQGELAVDTTSARGMQRHQIEKLFDNIYLDVLI
jgi:hypothetical protein